MRTSVLAVAATGIALLHPLHIAAQRPSGRSSAAVLSTHHLEALKSLAPQQQAELLLERTINGYADDFSIDPQTREWVFQTLRDITGKTLPHDAMAWRTWFTNSRR
jgi:hypothetical protein